MPRKNIDNYTTIWIKKKDLKKLEDMKVHKNQPIWELIRDLVISELKKVKIK